MSSSTGNSTGNDTSVSDDTSADSALDAIISRASFNGKGLLPAVIQQFDTREVLMLGWMDAEALRRTYTSGRVTFWSRSRQEYWRKGDTSGHAQFVKSAALDCDGDTLLVEVDQVGAACHTGDRTCFDADHLHPVVGNAPAAPRPEAPAPTHTEPAEPAERDI
ncbi:MULTISPECIES: phosphoribosyl-AMP cyclohydrolase [Subtercola]|uniref:Phosphoribosyl-AMP cyclohydrolase n=1 Tax=Subtercola vilae TaxID=2056433 RepID=A0A4T2C3J5_9MICO|nr:MULTISPECIES: phosphoribosyl-AMP cyclohydrolase [Subtercola]MEA9986318.1 phosphoribosyl-AMP cyclohydrolase [Subtercola sp. RTI3]TIH37711.1 phosphoribosyl-AMP cyclohydrolase [Subtercola vilae]